MGATRRRYTTAARRELHFGHTRIILVEGTSLDFPQAAIYTGGNARGVMASGVSGAIRLAGGAEIERELRAFGHLTVGAAYITGSGRLAERGVQAIVHGIVTSEPGEPHRRANMEDALIAGLQQASERRVRSLTLPEVGLRLPQIDIADAAELCVRIVSTHLRRNSTLESVTIAGHHLEYLRRCRDQFMDMGATTA